MGGTITVIDVETLFEKIDLMPEIHLGDGTVTDFNRRHRPRLIQSTRIPRRLVRPPYTLRTGRQIILRETSR